ncbi:MAG: type 4a pilus biogenesis protein PilO, partial [bacterium]|nr:type 4a pilus biogenesis protein PilO [bacterium]
GYGVLIAAAIIAVFYFMIIKNQGPAYDAEFKKLQDITTKINAAKMKEQEKENVEREIEVLKMKLEYAREKLPTNEEIDKLLREIHDIGLQARIKFVHFLPGAQTKSGDYFNKPIDIKVVGPYHQVGIFLNKIGGLPRIVNVQSISMRRVNISESQGVEEVSIKAFTYIYPESKPAAPKPPQQ